MQIPKKRPGYNREHMMAKKLKISSFIFIWECELYHGWQSYKSVEKAKDLENWS